MWRLRRYLAKFANSFWHSRAEKELAREVAAHLALMEEEFQNRGMAPIEARLAARRAYGSIEQAKEISGRAFLYVAGTNTTRSSVRVPKPRKKSGLHCSRGAHACLGHWSECYAFFSLQCRGIETPPRCRSE